MYIIIYMHVCTYVCMYRSAIAFENNKVIDQTVLL